MSTLELSIPRATYFALIGGLSSDYFSSSTDLDSLSWGVLILNFPICSNELLWACLSKLAEPKLCLLLLSRLHCSSVFQNLQLFQIAITSYPGPSPFQFQPPFKEKERRRRRKKKGWYSFQLTFCKSNHFTSSVCVGLGNMKGLMTSYSG